MPYLEYNKIYQTIINMEYLSTFTASQIIYGKLFYFMVLQITLYNKTLSFYKVIS